MKLNKLFRELYRLQHVDASKRSTSRRDQKPVSEITQDGAKVTATASQFCETISAVACQLQLQASPVKMSNFPSIEEFDSGITEARKFEDGDGNLIDSAQEDFLAREQAVLGDDADFFQSASVTAPVQEEGEAAFFQSGQGEILSIYEGLIVR